MNQFSISYYASVIKKALSNNYKFVTVKEYLELGCPSKEYFILRHDLDKQPQTLKKQLDVERECGVRSTIYARVTANEYNAVSYPVINLLRDSERDGFEIGLHSNFIEYAEINNLDPLDVLRMEYNTLNSFLNIDGIAPHRDINYAYNTLPFLQSNWEEVEQVGLKYHAYDDRIFSSSVYVNEGLNPHLCWRNKMPEDVVLTGDTVYMMTHNHWWYKDHPFEEWA